MTSSALGLEELGDVDKIWHLRQATLFSGLSLHDLDGVAAICSDHVHAKGDVIFYQDDVADSLYILNRGSVRVSLINDNGRERIINLLRTGDIFGEDLFGLRRQRQVQATAHEECWTSKITRENFRRLLIQKPRLTLNLVEILTHKLTEARQDIGDRSFLDSENRVVETLLKLSRSHGKPTVCEKKMTKLKIPLSHVQLARMIGGNRPHISKIMSKFKKRGWVLYHGRKLLINADALANLSKAG